MKQRFTASVSREDDWYVAQCLEVDVVSQGKTEDEAVANLQEALELYFEPPTPSIAPRRREVAVGTLHSIVCQVGISTDEWEAL